MAREFGFGIEEEHQILDPGSGELRSEIERLLPIVQAELGDRAQPELYQAQIETATEVCESLADARAELIRLRRALLDAAARLGVAIATAGTHPFSDWRNQRITRKTRYQRLLADYQQVAREQVLFGCHVHVGIPDLESTVQTMNRVRAWLPTILALTANSPFWLVSDLVGSGSIRDATKVYWDVRPSTRYPTLEFRIADACTSVDEALMVAGLCRALARACCEAAWRDEPPVLPPVTLLRAAKWQAARFGLEGQLVDPGTGEVVQVPEMARRLLAYLRPVLEDEGDWEEVCELLERVLTKGNGAIRQRRALARGGFPAVMEAIATAPR